MGVPGSYWLSVGIHGCAAHPSSPAGTSYSLSLQAFPVYPLNFLSELILDDEISVMV